MPTGAGRVWKTLCRPATGPPIADRFTWNTVPGRSPSGRTTGPPQDRRSKDAFAYREPGRDIDAARRGERRGDTSAARRGASARDAGDRRGMPSFDPVCLPFGSGQCQGKYRETAVKHGRQGNDRAARTDPPSSLILVLLEFNMVEDP
jgi:hypothetical protein